MTMKFDFIKNIDLKEDGSWQDSVFLTLDLDWVIDEVLEEVVELLDRYGVKATLFVTHDSRLVSDLKQSDNFEIGIHPNFNPLLSGDYTYGKNFKEVIAYYKQLEVNATSIRSHSLTQNSLILDEFCNQGFTHECNLYIPHQSSLILKPFNHWKDALIRVPHFWEDDVHLVYNHSWNLDELLTQADLKVFDFHPIHVFLNTNHIDRYNQAKSSFKDYKELKKFKNNSTVGIRNYFMNLIQEL